MLHTEHKVHVLDQSLVFVVNKKRLWLQFSIVKYHHIASLQPSFTKCVSVFIRYRDFHESHKI